MVSPPDGYAKVYRLERVLQSQPNPVVLEDAVLQCLCERYAEERGEDHDGVRDTEDDAVAGDESAEMG
jgi:hypothetical protein